MQGCEEENALLKLWPWGGHFLRLSLHTVHKDSTTEMKWRIDTLQVAKERLIYSDRGILKLKVMKVFINLQIENVNLRPPLYPTFIFITGSFNKPTDSATSSTREPIASANGTTILTTGSPRKNSMTGNHSITIIIINLTT